MPEAAIGFVVDVGGTFFLARMPFSYGIYAGLTSTRIRGYDLR
jgi:enoyl-CoA hydratase